MPSKTTAALACVVEDDTLRQKFDLGGLIDKMRTEQRLSNRIGP